MKIVYGWETKKIDVTYIPFIQTASMSKLANR